MMNLNPLQYLLVVVPLTNQQKEQAMEDFLNSLHQLLPNNTSLSLELVSSDQFLKFYIGIPHAFVNIVKSQMYAQYPEAEIEQTEDYLSQFKGHQEVVQLDFKHDSVLPLKTHHQSEEDFLKNLSAILSKTESHEKVIIQFVLKRIGSSPLDRGVGSFRFGTLPSPHKLSRDLYKGKLRIAYFAPHQETAVLKLKIIVGLFKGFKGEHNELKKPTFIFTKDLPIQFKYRTFTTGDLWSAAELATLYHFPYEGTIVSNVINTTSKHAPAPDNLPVEGLINPNIVSFIGETSFRNEHKKFGIKRVDRQHHLSVVGKTGSGKSKLLELLLISDIQNGQGCCLLDPHGDLADELLQYVPERRIKDVVYVNPDDRDFPIGFNPLEPVDDLQMRQHLSTFFISIFKKLFSYNWNPRIEHLIGYITLSLLETPDSNILGIPRILSDIPFRQCVIQQIQDPVVKNFWVNEFSEYNKRFGNEAIAPILNKVGEFISNPVIRNMVGQRRNMLSFEKFMNSGKIVIMNISKEKLGDENAALLGSMVIAKIQQAALARSKFLEEERRDFYFYIDEFQNFATDAFSSILNEAQKYHLDLTIAHQSIAQLPEEVKASAFGDVGSMIVFAVGGDDAAYLRKEFSPVFSPDDMINLNNREMYVKMSIDGRITNPFSARTLDVPKPESDYSHEIIAHSRTTYGKNRTTVENEIIQWTTSTELIENNTNDDEGSPEPIL